MIKFEETTLLPELIKAVKDLNFEHLMPIQEKVIESMLETHRDLIGLAQTGTGKTAAFGLPLIHLIDQNSKSTQALILTPTRELCMQVANDLALYAKFLPAIQIMPVYGGTSIETQIRGLKKGKQIVVGTPGRVNDLLRRKILDISKIKTFILDEADEMLSMGFQEEINTILEKAPSTKQTLLFSATMPKEIAKIAQTYMDNPIEISVGEQNTSSKNIQHVYYLINAQDRYLALKRIVDVNINIYAIIFCRTRQETKEIAEKLIKDNYNADSLHGDLSQTQRDHVMQRFRTKNLQILVATDVAARGLDVNDLTHVINYNLPDDIETYIHRSGRTGRADKTGIAVNIIHTKEKYKINQLEKIVKQRFEQQSIPSGKEVCQQQLFKLIDQIQNITINDEQISPFLPLIYQKLDCFNREELIQRFVSVEFNHFLDYYKNASDLNIRKNDQLKTKNRKKDLDRNHDYVRFFISLGKKNGLTPPKLIGLINDSTNRKDIQIGKIEIMDAFSFFEIENSHANQILNALKKQKFYGEEFITQLAQNKKNNRRSKRR